jgi:hypothetical protein
MPSKMGRTDLIDAMLGVIVAHGMAEITMYCFFAHDECLVVS